MDPFQIACLMTAKWWFEEGRESLLGDGEEKFIPGFFWFIAVKKASSEDGDVANKRACIASSLVTSAMLDLAQKQMLRLQLKWVAYARRRLEGKLSNIGAPFAMQHLHSRRLVVSPKKYFIVECHMRASTGRQRTKRNAKVASRKNDVGL
jgi:hypothetical protein